jgi:hypothetical protein
MIQGAGLENNEEQQIASAAQAKAQAQAQAVATAHPPTPPPSTPPPGLLPSNPATGTTVGNVTIIGGTAWLQPPSPSTGTGTVLPQGQASSVGTSSAGWIVYLDGTVYHFASGADAENFAKNNGQGNWSQSKIGNVTYTFSKTGQQSFLNVANATGYKNALDSITSISVGQGLKWYSIELGGRTYTFTSRTDATQAASQYYTQTFTPWEAEGLTFLSKTDAQKYLKTHLQERNPVIPRFVGSTFEVTPSPVRVGSIERFLAYEGPPQPTGPSITPTGSLEHTVQQMFFGSGNVQGLPLSELEQFYAAGESSFFVSEVPGLLSPQAFSKLSETEQVSYLQRIGPLLSAEVAQFNLAANSLLPAKGPRHERIVEAPTTQSEYALRLGQYQQLQNLYSRINTELEVFNQEVKISNQNIQSPYLDTTGLNALSKSIATVSNAFTFVQQRLYNLAQQELNFGTSVRKTNPLLSELEGAGFVSTESLSAFAGFGSSLTGGKSPEIFRAGFSALLGDSSQLAFFKNPRNIPYLAGDILANVILFKGLGTAATVGARALPALPGLSIGISQVLYRSAIFGAEFGTLNVLPPIAAGQTSPSLLAESFGIGFGLGAGLELGFEFVPKIFYRAFPRAQVAEEVGLIQGKGGEVAVYETAKPIGQTGLTFRGIADVSVPKETGELIKEVSAEKIPTAHATLFPQAFKLGIGKETLLTGEGIDQLVAEEAQVFGLSPEDLVVSERQATGETLLRLREGAEVRGANLEDPFVKQYIGTLKAGETIPLRTKGGFLAGFRQSRQIFPLYSAPGESFGEVPEGVTFYKNLLEGTPPEKGILNVYLSYLGIGRNLEEEEGVKVVSGGRPAVLETEATFIKPIAQRSGESEGEFIKRYVKSEGTSVGLENLLGISTESQVETTTAYTRFGENLPGMKFVSEGRVGKVQVRVEPETLVTEDIPVIREIERTFRTQYTKIDIYQGTFQRTEAGEVERLIGTGGKSLNLPEYTQEVEASRGKIFVSEPSVESFSFPSLAILPSSLPSEFNFKSQEQSLENLSDAKSVSKAISRVSYPSSVESASKSVSNEISLGRSRMSGLVSKASTPISQESV